MPSAHRPTISTGSATARPLSTIHGHSASSDHTPNPFGQDNVTVVSSIDLDRGYFSGNEAENRRVNRNVLRKTSKDIPSSAQHSRAPSFAAAFRRRSGSATHVRGTSGESIHDSVGPMNSPTKSYSSRFRQPKRSASGPEARSS